MDLNQVPEILFNSFCTNPNQSRNVIQRGQVFTVYSFPGSLGAIGINGSKDLFIAWEEMPAQSSKVKTVFELKSEAPEIIIEKGNSKLLNINDAPFSRIIRTLHSITENRIPIRVI